MVKVLGQTVIGIGSVPGDDMHAAAEGAVGHGDPCLGRDGDSGGDARDFLAGNTFVFQGQEFFATPAKDVGISALQPHHCAA